MLYEPVDGKDLLVRAKTETGKTLTSFIPGIERMVRLLEREAERREGKGGGRSVGMNTVWVFVISLTREIALNLSVELADESVGLEREISPQSTGRSSYLYNSCNTRLYHLKRSDKICNLF